MRRIIIKQIFQSVLKVLFFVFFIGTLLYTVAEAKERKMGEKDIHSFDKYWDRSVLFSKDQDWTWDDEWEENENSKRISSCIRYNRVEGLYLGLKVNRDYYIKQYSNFPFLYGFLGYSFAEKNLQYQIGIEKGFFNEYRLAFGGEYHNMIDTPDRWIIPDLENSLAAFFLKEDFQDFFLREGASGYITQNFTKTLAVSAFYQYDKLNALKKNTNWSLFGGKKQFRENPVMNSLEIRSITGRMVFDSRNSKRKTTKGWYVQVEMEHTVNEPGSDFNFDRLLADIRRYQPLGYSDGIDLRVRLGTSQGELPWQRSFYLGGLSTLRGFPYKSFPDGPMNLGGNRMVLIQLEYRMGSQDLPDDIDLGILEYFNLILFTDVGWVDYTGTESKLFDGFKKITLTGLKNNVGIALANRSGNVRFEVARRTDIGEKPFVFSFRINRAF